MLGSTAYFKIEQRAQSEDDGRVGHITLRIRPIRSVRRFTAIGFESYPVAR
jgi:hypothetical protein